MSATPFRFVSTDRRVREDRRFVVGKGRFAADIALAGTRHVALVTCPHPAARIVSIDKSEALAMPGVHYVLDGRELAAATQPLLAGLDTPNVPRRPLAVDVARYAGEWVAAVVADTRALAEDAAELVRVEYEPLPFVLDGEEAYAPGSPLVHAAHGSNVLLDRTFVWGEVEKDFAESPHRLSLRVKWGRSSTVPIETFGVTASWDPWREILDVWASIQMPNFPDQIALALKLPGSAVRVHNDVDVGGSYGVKRGIKHAVLVGYLSRRLGFPVRLIEDRLENMRGGDAHGPERNFDVEVAFDDAGVIRSMKMRALDNVGAYAGRSPFQLGKPVGAIVGPYRIKSVQYQAIAVIVQQDGAGGGARLRPVADQLRHRAHDRGGGQASRARPPGGAAAQPDPRRAVPLSDPERHHLRQRRLPRRHRQGAGAGGLRRAGRRARPAARAGAARRHRHRRLPRAERRQFVVRAAAQSQERDHHLDGVLPHQRRPQRRRHRDHAHDSRPGRATRRWSAPWSARCWRSIPTASAWCGRNSLTSLPSNSPVGSRMAIMLGGAAFHAAQKLKDQDRSPSPRTTSASRSERVDLRRNGNVFDRAAPDRSATWNELVTIAHRHFHRLPPGIEPGLAFSHIMQVPTGGTAADRRRPRADVSLLRVRVPPDAGRDRSRSSASPRSSATSSATTAAP